jgi:hypothetical protein
MLIIPNSSEKKDKDKGKPTLIKKKKIKIKQNIPLEKNRPVKK